MCINFCYHQTLTLSWRRSLSYRNRSINFLCKSKGCFLYDRDLRHEKVQEIWKQTDKKIEATLALFNYESVTLTNLRRKINVLEASIWRRFAKNVVVRNFTKFTAKCELQCLFIINIFYSRNILTLIQEYDKIYANMIEANGYKQCIWLIIN